MIRLADMLGMDSFLRAISAELHIACVGIRPCNFRFVRLLLFVLLCWHPITQVVDNLYCWCRYPTTQIMEEEPNQEDGDI